MNQVLRKQIAREFPELAAGYHLPVMAEVLAIPDAPAKGGINDNYRPRLAVNVVLLNNEYQSTQIYLDAVPMSIMGGGNERGFFALPQKGTIVELAWMNGSPERPFVRSVLGDRQALPWIDEHTMAWQQSEEVKQTVDNAGNWTRETTATIKDKSHTHEIETHKKIEILGEEIKRVLQHSLEDIDGKKQIEASAIHLLSTTVANTLALGSVNLMAGEHITRSAGKNIIDKATGNLEQTALKIHLGTETDNLLKLVSDFMAAVSDGFNSLSSNQVMTAAQAGVMGAAPWQSDCSSVASDIDGVKATLDGMTLTQTEE